MLIYSTYVRCGAVLTLSCLLSQPVFADKTAASPRYHPQSHIRAKPPLTQEIKTASAQRAGALSQDLLDDLQDKAAILMLYDKNDAHNRTVANSVLVLASQDSDLVGRVFEGTGETIASRNGYCSQTRYKSIDGTRSFIIKENEDFDLIEITDIDRRNHLVMAAKKVREKKELPVLAARRKLFNQSNLKPPD